MVELRLLVTAAGSVERFTDKPRAFRPQPLDLSHPSPAVVEDAGFIHELAALDPPRPKDQVSVVVLLVAFLGRGVEGRDYRHAPPDRHGLGVLKHELPPGRQDETMRQGHDDLAADRRVLPRLSLVHEPGQLAGCPVKVDALRAQDALPAAKVVRLLEPRIDAVARRDVGDLRGRAVAQRARERLQGTVKEIFTHKNYSSVWPGPAYNYGAETRPSAGRAARPLGPFQLPWEHCEEGPSWGR